MMKTENLSEWNKQKAEELFSMSHKMLDIAKELTECNAKELQIHVNHALELAKHSTNGDLKKIEKLQNDAALEASLRMDEYKVKAKTLLVTVHNELTDHSAKHVLKAMDSLADWIEHSDNKMPELNEHLGSVVRNITASGASAFEEGRKLVNSTLDGVDHALNQMTDSNQVDANPHVLGNVNS